MAHIIRATVHTPSSRPAEHRLGLDHENADRHVGDGADSERQQTQLRRFTADDRLYLLFGALCADHATVGPIPLTWRWWSEEVGRLNLVGQSPRSDPSVSEKRGATDPTRQN